VVLDLPFLRGERTAGSLLGDANRGLGAAVYTRVPGYLTEAFPRSPGWDRVVAYLWLDPKSFYSCPLLAAEERRMEWLRGFELRGGQFEVLS